MASEPKNKRTRTDWRRLQHGTVEHYLIECYPHGLDYCPAIGVDGAPLRLHDRTLDDEGLPALSDFFLSRIDRVPWAQWKAAADELCEHEEGKRLILALGYYQQNQIFRIKGFDQQKFSDQMGCSVMTLMRMRKKACILLAQIVMMRERETHVKNAINKR